MRRYIVAMTAAFLIVAPFAMSRWGDSQAQEKPTKAEKKAAKTQEQPAQTQEKPAQTQEKPAQTQEKGEGDVEAGRGLYTINCKKCHGDQGEGNPRMYKLVKATLVHLGSPAAQNKSDAEIRKATTAGFGKMEAVKGLTPEQVTDILAFTRTLKQ